MILGFATPGIPGMGSMCIYRYVDIYIYIFILFMLQTSGCSLPLQFPIHVCFFNNQHPREPLLLPSTFWGDPMLSQCTTPLISGQSFFLWRSRSPERRDSQSKYRREKCRNSGRWFQGGSFLGGASTLVEEIRSKHGKPFFVVKIPSWW